jgi:hypothetical protein
VSILGQEVWSVHFCLNGCAADEAESTPGIGGGEGGSLHSHSLVTGQLHPPSLLSLTHIRTPLPKSTFTTDVSTTDRANVSASDLLCSAIALLSLHNFQVQ